MQIIDNINALLGDDLKKTITPGAKLKIAASCFSIYAFEALKAELEQIESVQFIFTSPICTLKHSDNTISRRQEVGRGMRLARDQNGDRIDDPAIVHQVNVLTVVANESYKDFVVGLQKDIGASLSARPRQANAEYFAGKVLKTLTGDVPVTPPLAKLIERYLAKNDYTDPQTDHVSEAYHTAKKDGTLAALPPELAPYAEPLFQLIDTVFSDAQLTTPKNAPLGCFY